MTCESSRLTRSRSSIIRKWKVAHPGHENDVDTVTLHGFDVGGWVIGIDGHHREVQLLQDHGYLAVKGHRGLQCPKCDCGGCRRHVRHYPLDQGVIGTGWEHAPNERALVSSKSARNGAISA